MKNMRLAGLYFYGCHQRETYGYSVDGNFCVNVDKWIIRDTKKVLSLEAQV